MPAVPAAPRLHEATEPILDIPIDLLERYLGITKAEVIAPANQKPVDGADHFLHRLLYPSYGHIMYPAARPFSGSLQRPQCSGTALDHADCGQSET